MQARRYNYWRDVRERARDLNQHRRCKELKKVLALLLALVCAAGLALALAGCGPSAEQILKDSIRTSKENIKTVHFELEQKTKLPRAPIEGGKVSKKEYVQKAVGDYDLRTGDFQVKTDLMPGVGVTMLQVGENQYWEIQGNWYDVPQSVQLSPAVTQALSTSQYIKEFENLKKLGDMTIDGQSCYHVRGVPNMKELIKQPGITELLKDPTGKQVRTVDELEGMKAVFDFYVQKDHSYFKRSESEALIKASNDFIKLGYAQPGDNVTQTSVVTFSNYNAKVEFKPPEKTSPLPTKTPGT